jgi:hypothetical protein
MSTKEQPCYSYDLAGTVVNLTGVILPSDQKEYLEFGFSSQVENQTHNGVFYIRLEDATAGKMAAAIVRSFVNKTLVTVTFNTSVPWDKTKDASYVISGARAGP